MWNVPVSGRGQNRMLSIVVGSLPRHAPFLKKTKRMCLCSGWSVSSLSRRRTRNRFAERRPREEALLLHLNLEPDECVRLKNTTAYLNKRDRGRWRERAEALPLLLLRKGAFPAPSGLGNLLHLEEPKCGGNHLAKSRVCAAAPQSFQTSPSAGRRTRSRRLSSLPSPAPVPRPTPLQSASRGPRPQV